MSGVVDDLQHEMGALLASMTAEQVQYRPAGRPEAWSIQQIAEHLIATYNVTIQGVEKLMAEGRTPGRPTAQQRMQQMYVTKLGQFPHGRISPEMVKPPDVLANESGYEIFARMTERLSAMQVLLQLAEERFGAQPCVIHHVMGPMSADRWRRFHAVHGRHHMKQIEAIRKELGL